MMKIYFLTQQANPRDPPCIMCVQYRGGCSVPWGVFSTVGGTILWNLSTVEGYHDACGGYHEYCGGCSVPWGTQITKDFSPHGTEHPSRYSRYPPHLS